MKKRRALPWAFLALIAVLASCDNMEHQMSNRTYDPSNQFGDGASARQPPAHTIQSGPRQSDTFRTGRRGGQAVAEVPERVTLELLQRGRECFNAQCAECHGEDGNGRGIVVRRGFPQPPAFVEPRLLEAPAGHFFEVITQGFGVMVPAGFRVALSDRWAIVAYVRALQLSQHASLADVPESERTKLLNP